MLGIADGADDVPPAGEKEGSQEESDLAVPAEQEDAGDRHGCLLFFVWRRHKRVVVVKGSKMSRNTWIGWRLVG